MTKQIQIGEGTTILAGEELEEQIERVVKQMPGGTEREEREREVLRILAGHRGAALAVKGEQILRLMDMEVNEQSRRWLKAVVQDLVVFYKVKVGATRSRKDGGGYFLIMTQGDLDAAIHPLWGEVYALLRRLRALTSKKDVARLFGQAQLQFDQGIGPSGDLTIARLKNLATERPSGMDGNT